MASTASQTSHINPTASYIATLASQVGHMAPAASHIGDMTGYAGHIAASAGIAGHPAPAHSQLSRDIVNNAEPRQNAVFLRDQTHKTRPRNRTRNYGLKQEEFRAFCRDLEPRMACVALRKPTLIDQCYSAAVLGPGSRDTFCTKETGP
ncbi:hypothetical protein GQ53DRAFT_838970 [Thozetella sp. PMI_491]|nr:hypothetical protein GQ53DRAFT_838970 [Thozetella sp. PMI_491]